MCIRDRERTAGEMIGWLRQISKKTVINEQLTVRRTVNKTDKIMNVCRNTVSRMKVSLWKPCFLMSFFTKKLYIYQTTVLSHVKDCGIMCKMFWKKLHDNKKQIRSICIIKTSTAKIKFLLYWRSRWKIRQVNMAVT